MLAITFFATRNPFHIDKLNTEIICLKPAVRDGRSRSDPSTKTFFPSRTHPLGTNIKRAVADKKNSAQWKRCAAVFA